MSFKIVGLEVVASYDAMSRKPGMVRPLPSVVSARVAEKMTETIQMQEVLDEALKLPQIGGELMIAMVKAREDVARIMNNHKSNSTPDVVLSAQSSSYRPTSSGGHAIITWVTQPDGSGAANYWECDIEVQGENIHAFACMDISLKEVPPEPVLP